jgi:hypothetical protein
MILKAAEKATAETLRREEALMKTANRQDFRRVGFRRLNTNRHILVHSLAET